jgi:hypothetical protein
MKIAQPASKPPPSGWRRAAIGASIALALIVALPLLSMRLFGPGTAPAPQTESSSREWRPVRTMTGQGTVDTAPFKVASPDWRIRWTAANGAPLKAGMLEIFVYDESGELVTRFTNKEGPGRDVADVLSKPGEHRLRVQTAAVGWTLTVEDRR